MSADLCSRSPSINIVSPSWRWRHDPSFLYELDPLLTILLLNKFHAYRPKIRKSYKGNYRLTPSLHHLILKLALRTELNMYFA